VDDIKNGDDDVAIQHTKETNQKDRRDEDYSLLGFVKLHSVTFKRQ
jgi:hypothetical protein